MSLYRLLQKLWIGLPPEFRIHVNSVAVLRRTRTWVSSSIRGHDDVYDSEYYKMIDRQALKSTEAITASIVSDFSPTTVLDVGCGTGALLKSLELKRVRGIGLEYSEAALEYCRARALAVYKFNLETEQPMPFDNGFDVVVSLEVAEHLPEQFADPFIDLLCRYGQAVIFTAAPPGQGGRGHLNEQSPEYWMGKFSQRSFKYDEERSMRWRAEWKQKGVSSWYSRNLMIFLA